MAEESSETKIKRIAEAACEAKGVDFVHLTIAGSKLSYTVTVYIDKDGGVSVEDCAEVSREMDEALDADELLTAAYILEVSSPGLERELYSLQDFIKFTGRLVKVKFVESVNERKNIKGVIGSATDDEIVLEVKGADDFRFKYGNVAKANLQIDLKEEFKKRRSAAE